LISREYKLKPTVKQKKAIDTALWQHIGLYNAAMTKCFISLRTGRLISAFDLIAQFSGNGKKAGLSQDGISETCKIVRKAFERWLYPRLSQANERESLGKNPNEIKSIRFSLDKHQD
jgi:hypothetical protein